MKKIFTVITLIFLFCNVFTSCNNSFLDEVPNHQLSDVSFWKTEDDVYKGEFYQFNLSSCIRQQNSLTAQFVSFSLSNLANIFYPPQFLQ